MSNIVQRRKNMEYIENLIKDTFKLFPEIINISDGELRDDDGFFSCELSKAWHRAEESTGTTGKDIDFMIWSIFRVLHRKGRENFVHGIYCVSLNEIDMEELQMEYQTVSKDSE